jgi:hypothetical protein
MTFDLNESSSGNYPVIKTDSLADILKSLTGIDPWICPSCKAGRLIRLGKLPKIRSPGALYEY